MSQIQNDLDYQHVDYMSCDPVSMDYAVPADGHTCSFEMLLSEPLCAITDDMTYQEKIETLIGTIYDYDDVIDNQPGYFDYDDPRDYEEWCDWNDPDIVEGYYDPLQPDVEGGFVLPRTDFGVSTETVVAASVLFSADLSFSEMPDLTSDFDPGPSSLPIG